MKNKIERHSGFPKWLTALLLVALAAGRAGVGGGQVQSWQPV
jgi:hypothetical protein